MMSKVLAWDHFPKAAEEPEVDLVADGRSLTGILPAKNKIYECAFLDHRDNFGRNVEAIH